jgi:hypothetical protein
MSFVCFSKVLEYPLFLFLGLFIILVFGIYPFEDSFLTHVFIQGQLIQLYLATVLITHAK